MEYKFLINAHHGGKDEGNISDNIKTKEINLAIAHALSQNLNNLKVTNQLIREGDETITTKERISLIRNLDRDDKELILISIDSSFSDEGNTQIIYSLRENGVLAKNIAQKFSDIEANFNEAYQKRLPLNPDKDYYQLLRETKPTSIIIKLNFSKENLKEQIHKCKEAILKGILSFVGIKTVYEEETEPTTYQVERGDTLWRIAKKFNLTVKDLKKLNDLPSSLITVDQVLKIKESEEQTPESPQEEIRIIPKEDILHFVTESESIYQIADLYNTTPDAIKQANNLIAEEINPGQTLLVPRD